MIKSVIIKTYPFRSGSTDFIYPTLNEMFQSQFQSDMKYPIIGVNRNVGSTSSFDPRKSGYHNFSFGVCHYFIRFNFTILKFKKFLGILFIITKNILLESADTTAPTAQI